MKIFLFLFFLLASPFFLALFSLRYTLFGERSALVSSLFWQVKSYLKENDASEVLWHWCEASVFNRKKGALYKGCILMGWSNPCGGLEPPVLRFHPTGQHQSHDQLPKTQICKHPTLKLFFWDTNLLSGFLSSLKSSLGSQEPAKGCAQW